MADDGRELESCGLLSSFCEGPGRTNVVDGDLLETCSQSGCEEVLRLQSYETLACIRAVSIDCHFRYLLDPGLDFRFLRMLKGQLSPTRKQVRTCVDNNNTNHCLAAASYKAQFDSCLPIYRCQCLVYVLQEQN